ncbi:MAG: ABC transporter permease subunit [Actinobacteria bacterium]|nr:ABC transporter permease subunit [Actinomycetota bacterium]
MSESVSAAEAPGTRGLPPGDEGPGIWQRYGVVALFLGPALILLGVWIVYPTIRTIIRSFFDRSGDEFVGLDNYQTLFEDDTLLTALRNNLLWLLIVPAFVTAVGLVFAVLLERVRFSTAFKVAVFMPMAISLFAAGVIWRLMYEKDPDQGTVNAAVAVVKDAVSPSGVLSAAQPSTDALQGGPKGGLVLERVLATGDIAQLGLTGIRSSEVPGGAEQAVAPEALAGGITGVVWRDFKPGGGTAGEVEEEELGLPGVTVELRDENGRSVLETTTEADGTFAFEEVESGSYRAAIGPETFSEPYAGVSWLGASLITPAIMLSYVWVWAGFAMVVIAAGLAAIPRDLLEAARTDGATEMQVFRRVTIPLLAPVLTVVFITMLIYVLKVFDIVIAVAPGSVQDDANVIALAMWRTSFGGVNDFGLGAAIAVFLFLLVIPILAINVRRFRREV